MQPLTPQIHCDMTRGVLITMSNGSPRSGRPMRFTPSGSRRSPWLVWSSLLMFAGLGARTFVTRGDSLTRPPDPSKSVHQRRWLTVHPDPIELGSLALGQRASRLVSVSNPLREPLAIERLETSCPCIRVGGVPFRLGPNEIRDLEVSFDPSEDPNFQGRLSVEVIGYRDDGRVVLQTRVNLTVERNQDSATCFGGMRP